MQSHLLAGPISINDAAFTWTWRSRRNRHPRCCPIAASYGGKNHYQVLGVTRSATSTEIKKAYRLLALKFHPDVSKDSQAEEVFKSIIEAYEVLSNQTTRTEYNQALNAREHEGNFAGAESIHGWGEVRQHMHGRYSGRHNVNGRNSNRRNVNGQSYYHRNVNGQNYYHRNVNGQNYYHRNVNGQNSYSEDDEADEDTDEADTEGARGSFGEVLKSTFISLFLMKTLGPLVSLVVSFGMALFDQKLDPGYKLGYAIALLLGGRGGVLLTMCLSFTSWACGKTSSSMVALATIAVWVGLHAARYAPFPQGALLLLLYMSMKNS